MQRKQVENPHKTGESKNYEIAIISISTSRFMKYGSVKKPEEAEDISGRIIIDLFENAGHKLHSYTLISDEGRVITRSVKEQVNAVNAVSYTHLRAHETVLDLVCRLLLEKKKKT